ncbi:MAG: hypothetical protein J1E84_08020 [Muribaculaceae bacterium]|nr:hypothetical protein [Muribaculaceae bacterium]
MKNIKYLISSLLFLLLGSLAIEAQNSKQNNHIFSVGIENTRFVYGQYIYKQHLITKLDISVYSEKLGFQYARGTIGYQRSFAMVNLRGEYIFGSSFNRSYYNTGAMIAADALFAKRLILNAKISPWYDSGYGYTTCYEAKIGCKITDHIDINAGYTNIPEYRMAENRIIAGFDFHVSKLYVAPYLSIGTKSNQGGKNIRILMGFGYEF